MRQQRTRLAVNVGNLLELLGAGAAVYGVDRLAGLPWALILAGLVAVVAAELIYDSHVWRIPLPHRPQPRVRLLEQHQRFRKRRLIMSARLATWFRHWWSERGSWAGRDSL